MLNEVTRLTKGDFRNVDKNKIEENCLNCKDKSWCATYNECQKPYGTAIKCRYWSIDKNIKHKVCKSCHGDGEFEISAGTHSFFQECESCNGTGREI